MFKYRKYIGQKMSFSLKTCTRKFQLNFKFTAQPARGMRTGKLKMYFLISILHFTFIQMIDFKCG